MDALLISGGTRFKAIWNDELHGNSFHKLRYLGIVKANEVTKIFPWDLKRFQNLEELRIIDCEAVTEVFEMGALVDQLRQMWRLNLHSLKQYGEKIPKRM